MADTEEIKEKYRGPPPRKDMTPSPSKERDWKGNDWFGNMAATENGTHNGSTHNGLTDERGCVSPTGDVGLPGLSGGEYVDPHLKPTRDYESSYAKLAMQGGHKGLLSMSNGSSSTPVVDDLGKRQKGCDNLSDYNKIALQGGHKNLLYIDGSPDDKDVKNVKHTTPTKLTSSQEPAGSRSKSEPRACGDWYSSGKSPNNNNATPPRKTISPPSKTTAQNQRRGNGNVIIPESRNDEAPRLGKKRFDSQSQRQEAPFATYY